MGHQVKLLHAKFVRPFVQTNKTDAADAKAIWTAAQQPAMRTVEPKTEDQQAILSLHRMRALLVKMRTMQVNQLRGLLYEYGTCFKTGRRAGLAEIRQHLDQVEQALPGCLFGPIRDQLSRIDDLDKQIADLERQLTGCQKRQADCQAIAAIPGIGMLTATALVATVT